MLDYLLGFLIGATLRRFYGMGLPEGWWSSHWVRRGILFVAGSLLFATAGWWTFGFSALLVLFWIPGHQLQEWGLHRWLLRYGPVGIFWWLAQRYRFPWGDGRFVDGSFALAELAAGGVMYTFVHWISHVV